MPRFLLSLIFCVGMALAVGCATAPETMTSDGFGNAPDFRNGWYHWATGAQSVREVAAIYHRDPNLTAELNRTRPEAIPVLNTPLYIPPIHDRALLRQILTRINEYPSSVPTTPPNAAEFLPPDQMLAFITRPEPEVVATPEPIRQPDPIIEMAQPSTPPPESAAAEPERTETPTDSTQIPLEAAPVPTQVFSLKEARDRYNAELEAAKSATASSGQFNWPVAGKIIRPYTTSGDDPFPGIAIEAPEGSPVYASRDGRVIFAGQLDGYGKVVIVDHGQGLASVYGYANEILVKERKQVLAGEPLALAGRPSLSSPSQVYFQIRRNSRPVNPLEFLR